MKTVIEMVREAETYATNEYMRLRDEAICEEYLDVNWHELRDERFAELVRADEREALETLYTDANYIFNNPPGEASQEVRDVIEWYAAAIRATGETK